MLIIKCKTFKIISLILISILLISVILFNLPDKIKKIIYKRDYSEYVEKYANEYNVDKNLVYAVIKAESNFKVNANSNKNAIGLMQLIESTADDVANILDLNIAYSDLEAELKKAETNIKLGTKYLSILLEKYNNVGIAITAYNAGIGTVDNWIKNGIIKSDGSDLEKIPYKETNNYVRKILRDYKIYSNLP